MRVIELKAENFARLKAVTIRPDGALVQVTGANSQGKSSTLDSIWAALKGRGAGIAEPIHKGQERATINLDIGEFVITRTFRRDKHGEVTVDLKVVAADGAEVRKSPQAVIDGLLGALSLDPLAFARAQAKDQFDILKRFVPGFDFEKNAAERKKAFDKRTDINRDKDREAAAALSVKLPPGPKPKPVDVAAKIDALQRAGEHNVNIETMRRRRERMTAEAEAKRDEADKLRARAVSLDKEADALASEADKIVVADPMDVTALRAEISDAERIKGEIAMHEERDRHAAAASVHAAASQTLTAEIAALDEAKKDAIEGAEMPVAELTLGDGEVIYKGIPFTRASHAEKLVVSASIAMAENPELRIIRCYEGSNLDSKSLGILAAMADTRGFQCWVERVDETGDVGFVIQDGENAS